MIFKKRDIGKRKRNGDVYISNTTSVVSSGSNYIPVIDGFLPAEQIDEDHYSVSHFVNFLNPQDGNNILEITENGIKVHGNIVATQEVSAYGESDGDSPFISSIEVIDNLNSLSTEAALSANQGRILKNLIDNLEVDVDLSSYYTKDEIGQLFQPVGDYLTEHQSLTDYLKKSVADGLYQPIGNYLTSHQSLDDYYTKDDCDGKFLTSHQSLADYIKTSEAESKFVTALGTSGNNLTWTKNGTTNNITVPYATTANSANSATSASKLTTSRKIWGQSFDGSADVSGAMTGVTNINSMLEFTSDGIKVKGKIVAEGEVSAYGDGGSGSSGGSGTIVDILTKWTDYTTSIKDTYALSAGLGYSLYQSISTLTNNFANYYTKTEADGKFQPIGNYLTSHQSLADYYTKTEADGKFLTSHQSLNDYYTKKESDDRFQPIGNYLTQHQSLADYLKSADADAKFVTALSTNGNYLTWTKNGTTNNITVPYATYATNATNATTATSATNATQLSNARNIWGQPFNGSADVSGAMTGVTNINDMIELTTTGIKVKGKIVAEGEISAYGDGGAGSSASGGGISDLLTSWNNYTTAMKDTYALSAGLGYSLYTSVNALSSNFSNYYTKTESDARFQPKGNYLTSHQSLANYVTLDGAQTITGIKTLGNRVGDVNGSDVNRLAITPYGHTGGPWYINSYDTASTAYLRIKYGSTTPFSFSHGGAFTANSIVKQGGTSTQFLKADGSVDSNSYALNSTLANYLAKSGGSMTNTNVVTNMNADLLDGYHYNRFVPKSIYNPSKGVLVTTNVSKPACKMLIFRIIGHTYSTSNPPIDTLVQIYPYQGNTFTNGYSMLNNGYKLPYVKVFYADDVVKMWIPYISQYNSFDVYCYDSMGGSDTNLVYSLTDSADVSSSGTASLQINPINSAFTTDNVASATKLNDNTTYTAYGNTFFNNGVPTSIPITAVPQMRYINFTGIDNKSVVGYIGRGASALDNLYLISYTSKVILGGNSGSSDVVVDTTHKVGIGVASPTYKLEVDGDASIKTRLGFADVDREIGFNQSRFCFGNKNQQTAMGVNVGSLLVSNVWADYTKVPTNGIYSKGEIKSDNEITATRYWVSSGKDAKIIINNTDAENYWSYISFRQNGTEYGKLGTVGTTSLTWNANTIWHAGNDGSGSGLDADLLDGLHYTNYLPSSSLRDYTNGTLIETDIVFKQYLPFYVEISGNGYQQGVINSKFIGYYYQTSMTYCWSTHLGTKSIDGMVVMNYGGKLAFWFPSQGYWHGYRVWVSSVSASESQHNHVTALSNVAKPSNSYEYSFDSANKYVNAFTSSNVASATKLQNSRTLWGQSFDGTANVSGNMSNVGSITFSENTDYKLNIYKDRLCFGSSVARDMNVGSLLISSAWADYTKVPTNGLYVKGHIKAGTDTDSYALNTASFICDSWIRSKGSTGWYNETYGGGWYMLDSTWIRNYNNKSLYMNTGTIRTDGQLQVGSGGAKFLVNSSGNVGINTTSPTCKLHVKGDVLLEDGDVTIGDGQWLILDNSRSSTTKIDYIRTGASLMFGNNSAPPTNEYNPLTHAKTTSGYYWGLQAYNNTFGLYISRSANKCENSTVWDCATGDIKHTGNLAVTGEVTAYFSSDKRLKENVESITNATDILNKLNPVTFNWNDKAKELNHSKDNRKNFGLIAQEVEEVIPSLVHEVYGEYKSLDYEQLISILIKSNQELSSKLEEEKKRNDRLEERITKIEKLLNNG